MVRVKPLQTLLNQADAFLKTASDGKVMSKEASEESSVSALAGLLARADANVTISFDPEAIKQAEIDKIAESLNRVQTATEIDVMLKLAQFESNAKKEGFTDEQVNEAMSKIAAEKIAKNIPLLAAMGYVGFSGEDKNSLPPQPSKKKSQGQLLKPLNLTKSVGY